MSDAVSRLRLGLKKGLLEALLNGEGVAMVGGSVLFVAPDDLHNVRNVAGRATYVVITWRTPKTGAAMQRQ